MERRAIFITGAARGIGKALAEKAVREGCFVGLADIDADALAQTAAAMGTEHTIALPLDVRDRAQWDAALAAFAQVSGG
ncbi:MAG: SDR family NAD(P)-dependent oxidoreductase, partial [Sphingobium sp.]